MAGMLQEASFAVQVAGAGADVRGLGCSTSRAAKATAEEQHTQTASEAH